MKWTEKNIPDLTGKIIVITGANSGIGLHNTKQFAKKGATVVMACRNLEKGQKAIDNIMRQVENAKIQLMKLDLGSLDSINEFTEQYKKKYDRLDVLLNNAGIMMTPYQKTSDGFESQIGINHLGHFALTAQLFDLLKTTDNSRIVNVSSLAHRNGNMDWNDFLFEENYDRSEAYGRSKLANLLFTYELDRRVRVKDYDVKVLTSHPGVAATNLADHLLGPMRYIKPIIFAFMLVVFGQTSNRGALPSSRAATDPNAKSGEYYGPVSLFGKETRGYPRVVESNSRSHNEEDAKKLWNESERLTGMKFEV